MNTINSSIRHSFIIIECGVYIAQGDKLHVHVYRKIYFNDHENEKH